MMPKDYHEPEAGGGASDHGTVRRPADHVWVLTGSIGALTAAIRLLDRLSPQHPLAFIVALRVTTDTLPLITSLLTKSTPFHAFAAGPERTLYPRDVMVLPINGDTAPDPDGTRSGLQPRTLDELLTTIAERYQAGAGVIALSGIGTEGARGCQMINRYGGRVWTQDVQSCEHPSFPNAVLESCEVSFSATPELLAERLMATVPVA